MINRFRDLVPLVALALALPALAAAPAPAKAPAPKKAAAKSPAVTKKPSAAPPAANVADKFHLKPGATGKICLGCHADFEDNLKKPFVHTPVKAGNCTDCHSPHASSYEHMLQQANTKVCVSCHADILPEKPVSAHPDVVKGNCVKCHDPHASTNKGNLLKAGNALCLDCHKDLGQHIAGAKFQHAPVSGSCLTCHNPHAGSKTEFLLAKGVPELCVGCHKPQAPQFQKAHLGYPVAGANCTSCHDPHGSPTAGLLWASVHDPVRRKQCSQCHNEPGAANALQVKQGGIDRCRGCHQDVVNSALSMNRVHGPMLDPTACLNCHNPHAGRAARLLRKPEKQLCGGCHADAVTRQDRSVTKHPPIEEGTCTACHQPHASNAVFLLEGTKVTDTCGKCHDWGKHQAHPLGPEVVDPRNKNLTVDCLACHRTHGSSFKHLAHYDTKMDLCTQCHVEMGR